VVVNLVSKVILTPCPTRSPVNTATDLRRPHEVAVGCYRWHHAQLTNQARRPDERCPQSVVQLILCIWARSRRPGPRQCTANGAHGRLAALATAPRHPGHTLVGTPMNVRKFLNGSNYCSRYCIDPERRTHQDQRVSGPDRCREHRPEPRQTPQGAHRMHPFLRAPKQLIQKMQHIDISGGNVGRHLVTHTGQKPVIHSPKDRHDTVHPVRSTGIADVSNPANRSTSG